MKEPQKSDNSKMLEKPKYTDFKVNDFVDNEEFRGWVISPSWRSKQFWNDFLKNNPQKKESIQLARQIVEHIYFEEQIIPKEDYLESLNFLKNYLDKKPLNTSYFNKVVSWWSKVAAILIIPLLVSGIIYYSINKQTALKPQHIQYMVANGEKSKVILADGTFVWLNSGSKLDYIIDLNSSERKVYLTGEAYFDVAKDDTKPFMVETKNYTVKVYGTRFNVNSYESDNISETVLDEGLVAILFKNQKEEVKIHPGERFLLNDENRYSITKVDTDLYSCWKNNVLKINSERLEDVVVRLERWYGVKIQIEDFERVKDLKYTLTIKTESLREMLDFMKYITPFEYKIDGENIFLTYN